MKIKFIDAGNITELADVVEIKLDNEIDVAVANFSKFCAGLDKLIEKYQITDED